MPINFRSDNEAAVHEFIINAIIEANTGDAQAYGSDTWTAQLNRRFSELFDHEVTVFPLVSGTAANAMTIAHCVPSYGAVLCHREAHLNVDECGAGEFFSNGAKLIGLDGNDGKLTPDAVTEALACLGFKGDHDPLPRLLSLTQATEWGTVYRTDEVNTLADLAHDHNMKVHMDGARFANALVSLGCSPRQLTVDCGVDILSFGATKNGAMAAEAVIFFDPSLAEYFGRIRMKGGHLLSKMRYVSAQLLAYLDDDLWLKLARQANQGAQRVSAALSELTDADLVSPTQANEVFVNMSDNLHNTLKTKGFEYYRWPGYQKLYRLVVPYNIDEKSLKLFEQTCRDYV